MTFYLIYGSQMAFRSIIFNRLRQKLAAKNTVNSTKCILLFKKINQKSLRFDDFVSIKPNKTARVNK